MESLVTHFRSVLQTELPGEKAHVEMAPIKRPLPDEARNWKETKLSGVLILLYPHQGRIFTSLMMRPDYGGVHSRQVSFPGGRKEAYDADLRQTALREAHEELNIEPSKVTVLGELSELYIPPSKSLVTPVLGFSHERPDFIADTREVGEIIEADFYQLLHPDSKTSIDVVRADYTLKNVPAYNYNEYVIWGATAMMINEIMWLLPKNV
ncbi:MAG: CoA pyrophosphatase [Vicingaceae bacterium]